MKISKFTILSFMLIGITAFTWRSSNLNHPMVKSFEILFTNYYNKVQPEKTYLHVDRSLYEPGDDVWFSVYLRAANDLTPSKVSELMTVELLNAKEEVLETHKVILTNGRAKGDFHLAENLPGGSYKIKAYTKWQALDSSYFEKEITVQAVVLPTLLMEMEFLRKGYSGGDRAIAKLELNTLENQPLANHKVTYAVNLDGEEVAKHEKMTTEKGIVYLDFILPKKLKSTDGTFNAMISYKGQTESINRSIPIVLNDIDLQFFPEGGDLVTGLESTVAFKALNEHGEPADIEGELYNSNDLRLLSVKTDHNGMGKFKLKPRKGISYYFKLSSPRNIDKKYLLPNALTKGLVLGVENIAQDVLPISIQSTYQDSVYLVLTRNEKIHHFKALAVNAHTFPYKEIHVPTKDLAIGSYKLTLFDKQQRPQCERLIFVNPHRQLNINIKTDKEKYLPREKVKMTVKVTDEKGKPAAASLSLGVSDDNLLTYADDKQGHILSTLLLESDLKGDLVEPNYYFEKHDNLDKQLEQKEHLDLVMMTHGWRKFDWKDIQNSGLQYHAVNNIEKKVVVGSLRNYGVSKGKVKVRLEGDPREVYTDKFGNFKLPTTVDLSQPAVLTIIHEKEAKYIPVYHYGSVFGLYVGTPNYGVVVDEESGEPLIGCTVTLKGTTYGQMTDIDGRFDFSGFKKEIERLYIADPILVVSYTGYNTQEVKLNKIHKQKSVLTISMSEGTNLQEVVVTGYGSQRVITGAVTTVDSRNFTPRNKGKKKKGKNIATSPNKTITVSGQVNTKLKKRPRFANTIEAPAQHPMSPYYAGRTFYVPKYEKTEKVAQRIDFRPTIYWNPIVNIDKSGIKNLEFYASDDVTAFRVTAEGVGTTGQIGRKIKKFYTQKSMSITTKIPPTILQGDQVNLPITISNNTNRTLAGTLKFEVPKNFKLTANVQQAHKLAPNSSKTIYLPFIATDYIGTFPISVGFEAGDEIDEVRKTIITKSRGFPVKFFESFAGKKEHSFEVNMSAPIDNTTYAKMTVHTKQIMEISESLKRMLRQPTGCFEQVTSSNYPNIMVLQYLKETGELAPELEQKTRRYLDVGYKKLTGYETATGGFSLYGNGVGSLRLTAMGLVQFVEMSEVYPVSPQLIDRTAEWLLNEREAEGNWVNRIRGQAQHLINGQIVWALCKSGYGHRIEGEIGTLYHNAKTIGDTYFLALATDALLTVGDGRGYELLDQLLALQEENGSWSVRNGKNRYYWGTPIETTSLAVSSIIKSKEHYQKLSAAERFILSCKSGYGFGHTYTTVAALRTLIAINKVFPKKIEDGMMEVLVNNQSVFKQNYSAVKQEQINIPDLAQYLSAGKHTVKVVFSKTNTPLPIDFSVHYASTSPPSDKGTTIDLKTNLSKTTAKVGETVRLTSIITNLSEEEAQSPMAIIGIPSGLSVQPWQLKQLMDRNVFDFYEFFDGKIVFHFEKMNGKEVKKIGLDLKAEVPGRFEAPASNAFLYYGKGVKSWSKPEAIEILD